jgi:hypothetical protein
MPTNSVCAEIGVWQGDFSRKILNAVRPKVLHLIDPWKFEAGGTYRSAWYGQADRNQAYLDSVWRSVQERFRKQVQAGHVVIHRAASAAAAREFENSYFDWLYIDGNHLYEFVNKDLKSYFPKVRHGGYITGDDYEDSGWWQGGVKKAVDEFVSNGSCDVVLTRNNQFILRKKTLQSAD